MILSREKPTAGDWLKFRPLPEGYYNKRLPFAVGSYVSGTVIGKVTATGLHTILNTAAGDGSQTLVGILLDTADVEGTFATGSTGVTGTTGVDYTADIIGTVNIKIYLINPGAASVTASAVAAGDAAGGYRIEVTLGTDGSGNITTKSGGIAALVNGLVAPDTGLALVTAVDDGDNTTPLTVEQMRLTGGKTPDNDLVVMTKFDDCELLTKNLTYLGVQATVEAALVAAGAVIATPTPEVV